LKATALESSNDSFDQSILSKEAMKPMTLFELYVEELRNLYNTENQLVRALPKMAKAASERQLRAALTDRLHQTQVHLSRLEQVVDRLGIGPKGGESKVVELMVAESKDRMSAGLQPSVNDLAIIGAAHRLDHYEMACCGCVRRLAFQLGYHRATRLFSTTLEEQHERTEQFTELARMIISQAILCEAVSHRGLWPAPLQQAGSMARSGQE
jgi:ferritin-like metal-binding protein YciE